MSYNLRNRLYELMKEYNLNTQQDLANFAGVSKGLVNQWFNSEEEVQKLINLGILDYIKNALLQTRALVLI